MGEGTADKSHLDPVVHLPTIEGVKLTSTGLVIAPGTTKEEWVEISKRITRVGQGYHWWIADLAAYARHYLDGDKTLAELADATGYTRQYIGVLASMGKKYAMRERVRDVSMNHHVVASRIESPTKRKQYLEKARERGWSIDKMRSSFSPKEKRMVTVLMRIPWESYQKTSCRKALKEIAEKYKAIVFVKGSQRKQHRKRAVGRTPMIGVG